MTRSDVGLSAAEPLFYGLDERFRAPMRVVQEVLGHSTAQVMKRYRPVSPDSGELFTGAKEEREPHVLRHSDVCALQFGRFPGSAIPCKPSSKKPAPSCMSPSPCYSDK